MAAEGRRPVDRWRSSRFEGGRKVAFWPEGAARFCVRLCVVASLVCVAVELPLAIQSQGGKASRSGGLSYADREIAGGNSIVVDQVAAYAARGLIPVDATYRVVTGPKLTDQTTLTVPAISSWLTYFLMPRRSAGGAAWVVCYGCDTQRLGGTFESLWHDDVGISIGRMRS